MGHRLRACRAFRTFRFYPQGLRRGILRRRGPQVVRRRGGVHARRRRAARYIWRRIGRPPPNCSPLGSRPDRMCFARSPTRSMHGMRRRPTPCGRCRGAARHLFRRGVGAGLQGTLRPDPALALFDRLNRGACPSRNWTKQALRYLRKQRSLPQGWPKG